MSRNPIIQQAEEKVKKYFENKYFRFMTEHNYIKLFRSLIDLSDYSNTAVSVAQKVLPSVVGITVKSASVVNIKGELIISEDNFFID